MFEQLRAKWFKRLTGNNSVDLEDNDYKSMMLNIEKKATIIWGEMNKLDTNIIDDTRKELWSKYNSAIESAHVTSSFKDLESMAVAYASKGCSLYKNRNLRNDILKGLNWMYSKRYNERIENPYKNWWDWDIGAAQPLCNILILMYEDLTKEQIVNEIKALNYFNPTPFKVPSGPIMTGANLLDTALVSILKGIIGNSHKAILEAREAISDVLPYVLNGDGFYDDGSFIQHHNIPYAGGYGAVLMQCLDKLLFLLDGTNLEVAYPLISNVYDWIIESFEPLYYKGAIMDMVSGRGVSRETFNDHDRGKSILLPMLQLSYFAPEKIGNSIRSFIKENIVNDTICKDYYNGITIQDMLTIKRILNDDSIKPRGDLSLHKIYGAMDRAVHHREGFSIGISMYSNRIGSFEYGNEENRKGFHTSDGMIYLYNDDHEQYTKDYWPTVDTMRLSGITTDKSLGILKPWDAYKGNKEWVGGASLLDLYGVVGMDFKNETTSLECKKSWFCFDKEIVFLGASIVANDERLVETIVENRKIKGDNKFVVDCELKSTKFNYNEKIIGATWAYLEGNTAKGTDSIGYYFPEKTDITVLRENRNGNWNEINIGGSTDNISKNYFSIAIEHGINPLNETYAYVLLPNKNLDEIKDYSINPDTTIISNTADVQAVRNKKTGIIGLNFWKPSQIEYIEACNPSSIIIQETFNQLLLGASDPTHKQSKITIIINKKNYKLLSKDCSVIVEDLINGIKITIDTDKSMGKTHKLRLAKSKEN